MNRRAGTLQLATIAGALALAMGGDARTAEQSFVHGHVVDAKVRRLMVEHGFLPTRTTFLSDQEIAGKLDLRLPQLSNVKAALDANDAAALRRALIAYLDLRLPALEPSSPPKVLSAAQAHGADAWLKKTMTFDVNGQKKVFELGERANWFAIGDGLPDIAGWSSWGNVLAEAYLATGDSKYAQGLLTYVRAFYRDCRPPAQRTTSWDGTLGPWAVGGRGRATGLLQWIYRVVSASPVTTDADRSMFLKMIYEHAEVMYLFSEEAQVGNFAFYPISVLGLLSRSFPEFRDSDRWRQRALDRVMQSMDSSVLDDGGAQERSQYNAAYLSSYTQAYRMFSADPRMPELKRKLETMYDWFMWMLSPSYQYPSLNIGSMSDLSGYLQPAAELFPDRADLLYLSSKGAKGAPPVRTARALAHSGFLTMRSDWSPEALYLAMNYNGTLPEIPGTNPDLLSFGIWAHGRAYMTNAGTPVSYAHPLAREWCTQTKASNTVLVDQTSQHPLANGGRLTSWHDRPGFTYLAAESDNYRDEGVRHRRAVLFLRPDYWLVFDRLLPTDKSGKVHDYRWQGHFQPMDLEIDEVTKTVSTSALDGKRLYLVPSDPDRLSFERGKGLVADGVHQAENAVEGPYVRFIQKTGGAASFMVLIDPATEDAPPPVVGSLQAQALADGVSSGNAVGLRVRQGRREDVIGMAENPGPRRYGPLLTDGEVAYVRGDRGKIREVGLASGRLVAYDGQTLLEVSPEIESISLQYTPDTIAISVRGHGKISVAAGSEEKIVVNGSAVRARSNRWGSKRRELMVPGAGALALDSVGVSTDATAVYKALVGFRPGPSNPPWNPVVVTWKTSAPSDATIEYAPEGTDGWVRTTKPDAVTDHRLVLNRLAPDTTYVVRIRSSTDDGREGRTTLTYRCAGNP